MTNCFRTLPTLALLAALAGCGPGSISAAPSEVSQAVDNLLLTTDPAAWAGTYDTTTTPELRQAVTKADYEKWGRLFRERLGKFKSKTNKGFQLRSVNGVTTVQANYEAEFELGNGTINTTLTRVSGEWKFTSFFIRSPLLMEAPSVPCAACGKDRPKDAKFCPACGAKVEPAVAPGK